MKKNEKGMLYQNLKEDEKILVDWFRYNPLLVYIEIALIAMADVGIITKEEYTKYRTETEGKADLLIEYLQRRNNSI